MSDFVVSDYMAHVQDVASTVVSLVAFGMCIIVLIVTGCVYAVPKARPALDRISFRLMLWTLFFEFGYDLCYLFTWQQLTVVDPASVGCEVVIYFQIATMGIVNYLCTCVAINLMLSICFNVDIIRHRLEYWYIGVSAFLGFVIPIVPAALHHFGADPVYSGSCYFVGTDLKARLLRFGLEIYLWQGLATLIATGSVIAVLYKLFRQGRATAKALFGSHTFEDGVVLSVTNTSSMDSEVQIPRRTKGSRKKSLGMNHLQDKFLSIAVKVSLYPISLIFINTILTVGDMYLSRPGGFTTEAEWVLYCLYDTLYGGRGLFWAALCIFVDPCLRNGVVIAWHEVISPRFSHRSDSEAQTAGNGIQNDNLDLGSALASIPYSTDYSFSRNEQPLAVQIGRTGDSTDDSAGLNSHVVNAVPAGSSEKVDAEPEAHLEQDKGIIDNHLERRASDLERRRMRLEQAEKRFESVVTRI